MRQEERERRLAQEIVADAPEESLDQARVTVCTGHDEIRLLSIKASEKCRYG